MRNRRGQGLTEYLILVCLIAVSAIAIVSVLGQNIRAKYASISAAIRGESNLERQTTADSQQDYQLRGMDDFTQSGKKLGN